MKLLEIRDRVEVDQVGTGIVLGWSDARRVGGEYLVKVTETGRQGWFATSTVKAGA